MSYKPTFSSPLRADRARSVMRATCEALPSPLMGEGAGGSEDYPSSPAKREGP
jgi:hypothetical protein